MFQLLSIWTQYVDVIYMPESEIAILDTLRKAEMNPEGSSYRSLTEEKGTFIINIILLLYIDQKKRLETLFGKGMMDGDEADTHDK